MQASEEIKSLFVSAMLEQMLEQQNSSLNLTDVFLKNSFVLSVFMGAYKKAAKVNQLSFVVIGKISA
jgi:hypothetical protein